MNFWKAEKVEKHKLQKKEKRDSKLSRQKWHAHSIFGQEGAKRNKIYLSWISDYQSRTQFKK